MPYSQTLLGNILPHHNQLIFFSASALFNHCIVLIPAQPKQQSSKTMMATMQMQDGGKKPSLLKRVSV
jgi:hypothetical protein